MQVVPVPLKVTTVRSQNDLNPVISTFRSFSKVSSLVSVTCAPLSLDKGPDTPRAKRDDSAFPDGGFLFAMLSSRCGESCLSTQLSR